MCGILGALRRGEGGGPSRQAFSAALDTMRHRGPEHGGVWEDGPVVLGHRRLSVIGPSPTGNQPMSTPDGRWTLVFNGEIYNYAELKRGLEPRWSFRSATDTEVLLYLFAEKGGACVHDLVGMFAFAVWDRRESRLTLVRDRLGKRPLFVADAGRDLLFASEINALLALGVPREPDPEGILSYFNYGFIPYPRTAWRAIRRMEPATITEVDAKGVRSSRYWCPDFSAKHAPRSLGEAAEDFRARFRESVKSRLVADVPVGALLSGGLDSSAVVALAAGMAHGRLKTFAAVKAGGRDPEAPFAREVAARFGTDHQEIELDESELDLMPEVVHQAGEPFSIAQTADLWRVCRELSRSVVVFLGGDGADETFGGLPSYAQFRGFAFKHALARPAARLLAPRLRQPAAVHPFYSPWQRKVALLALPADSIRAASSRMNADAIRASLFTPEFARQATGGDLGEEYTSLYRATRSGSYLESLFFGDLTYAHSGIAQMGDLAAMRHSVEGRAPFMDHRLVEWAAGLPVGMKVPWMDPGWNRHKRILREAFRGLLPDSVLRRRKVGFATHLPRAGWLRGPWRNRVESVLLDPEVEGLGILDAGATRRLWREHLEGRDRYQEIWLILCFALWAREFLLGRRVRWEGTA